MASEPLWLSPDDVEGINRAIVAVTGENFFVRDHGLLNSACARPQQHWHYDAQRDVLELAVVLLLGVARNHPFEQGNKRTAFVAAREFLALNGWELSDGLDSQAAADVIIAAIIGETADDALVVLLSRFIQPLSS